MPFPLLRLGYCAALFIGAMIAGCSSATDNLPRQAVSGSVTLDGKPLEQGMIAFQPDQGNKDAKEGGTAINGGKYSISRDEGLVPGKYTVRITSSQGEAAPPADTIPGENYTKPTAKELVPGKYNTDSTLSAEVTAGGANTFDFPLTSK